jgi:hypothetical protein
MNYKNTFFEIDPMVIFKEVSPTHCKVLRLDQDYALDIEDNLSTAWKLLSDNKSLADVIQHFSDHCKLDEKEATEALNQLTTLLVNENLGKIYKNEVE